MTERRFSDSDPVAHTFGNRSYTMETETITTIKLLLTLSQQPSVLVTYLRRIQSSKECVVLHPAISVGKILADDSPVFEVVMSGDVELLQKMLSKRQCSFRDRDMKGTPLIHVRHLLHLILLLTILVWSTGSQNV